MIIRKLDPYRLYLVLSGSTALLYSLIFTVVSLYEVTVANLTPLQLVLVGTTLELSVLLFEVPTGIVADVYSRRLSIIIGFFLIGVGFMVEGLFPLFAAILLAQVLWGLGYTFTSGAIQAWLSDEIGEEQANRAFLRANQVSLAGAMAGMLAAIPLGSRLLNVPILVGAVLFIVLAGLLGIFMPEHGFKPVPTKERSTYRQMADTFRSGLKVVRLNPRLVTVMGIGLIYGLYSEGFDRLWVKHILDTFDLAAIFGGNLVTLFSSLRAVSILLAIIATRFVEKRVDTSQPALIARAMFVVTALISVGILGFAFAGQLILAVGMYWLVSVARNLSGPLHTAWVNQRLDSRVRATVLSMSGQVDAFGQIAGGPAIGFLANAVSVRAAISASGLLLTPALGLIVRAGGQSDIEDETKVLLPDSQTRD